MVEPVDGRDQRALGGERADVQLVDRRRPAAADRSTAWSRPAVSCRVVGPRQPVHPVRLPPGPRVGQHDVAAVEQVAVVELGPPAVRPDRRPGCHQPRRRGSIAICGRSSPSRVDEHEVDRLGLRRPDGERDRFVERRSSPRHSGHPTRTGSGTRVIAERRCTPPRTSRARLEQVVGGGPAPVGQGQGVLAGQAAPAPSPNPCRTRRARSARPRWSSPARRAGREPRRVGRQPRPRPASQDRVGEERAGAPGVVVSRVQHHPLAGPQTSTAARTSAAGARAPSSTPRRAGQLGVADRRGQGAEPELEGDRERRGSGRARP